MGGLINPPPTDLGSIPNIPVPDYAQQAQQATLGQQAAGWFDSFWKGFWEHKLPGLSAVIGLLASVADTILSSAVNLLTATQGVTSSGFYTMMAAVLGDLLGVEFDASAFQTAFQQHGRVAAVRQIGAAFVNTLMSEMAPSTTITPASGLAAAQAFLGFVAEFSVRQGNVTMLPTMLPTEIRILDGLREYGEILAGGLGLGRLSREALRGMMKVLVTDPLTWYLNQQYRPTLLSVNSMIRANMRGGMTDSDVIQYLEWLGYRDEDIPQLFLDAQILPSIAAYVAMNRTGFQESDTLANRLSEAGVPAARQGEYLDSITAQRCESHLNGAVKTYLELYRRRWIQHDDLVTQLRALGLGDQEVGFALGEVAPFLEYTTQELSLAQVEEAWMNGLVDLTYVGDWATRQGYSSTDQQLLQYMMLLKQKKETTAETIAAWRLRISCLNAKAKNYPLPQGFDANCNPT